MEPFRPNEIENVLDVDDDEGIDLKLVHLARITHKYHFKTIEAWSLKTLTTFFGNSTGPVPMQFLIGSTEAAILCDSTGLLSLVVTKWKGYIGSGQNLAIAIGMAERLNLRELLGLAYHAMMLKGRKFWESDPTITRSQRIRLLSGYYTISKLCETLPSTVPSLDHHASCMRRDQCELAWTNLWKAITSGGGGGIRDQMLNLKSSDLLGKVMFARGAMKSLVTDKIQGDGLLDGMHKNCLIPAYKSSQEKVKEVRDGLADWFSDVD